MKSWRVKQVTMVERKQAAVVASAVRAMDAVMKKALETIWNTYERTGAFIEPTFNEMDIEGESFYKAVVRAAFDCTNNTKKMQMPKKRLAAPSLGLPKKIDSLDGILKDKRYYKKIMNRSKKMTERLRKQYLKKIKAQMAKVVPMIENGHMSPREAKNEMMKAWNATKPRVETIFRTETTNYFAQTQVKFFEQDEDIIGFLFDSVRDTSRTKICTSRHGLVYRPNTSELDKNTPALHYNCRSHLIPLANTPQNIRLLEDPARDPRKRKVEPLPLGWRK